MNTVIWYLWSDSQRKISILKHQTYGSFDLGIRVPNSFIRSFMLNLRLLSTADKQEWQGGEAKQNTYLQHSVVTKQALFDTRGHEQTWNRMSEFRQKAKELGSCAFESAVSCMSHLCSWCYGIHIKQRGASAQNSWNKALLTEVMVVFFLPFFHECFGIWIWKTNS